MLSLTRLQQLVPQLCSWLLPQTHQPPGNRGCLPHDALWPGGIIHESFITYQIYMTHYILHTTYCIKHSAHSILPETYKGVEM